jgi:hypothetical protein
MSECGSAPFVSDFNQTATPSLHDRLPTIEQVQIKIVFAGGGWSGLTPAPRTSMLSGLHIMERPRSVSGICRVPFQGLASPCRPRIQIRSLGDMMTLPRSRQATADRPSSVSMSAIERCPSQVPLSAALAAEYSGSPGHVTR